MGTRSLTDIFRNFRNVALHNSHTAVEYKDATTYYVNIPQDDTAALVQNSSDIERDATTGGRGIFSLPPEWVDSLDEFQYDLSKIKLRMRDLSVRHDKHLNRPSMDDSVDEEHTIDITTQEITQMFHQCHRSIQRIQSKGKNGKKEEQLLLRNVVSSHAAQLQELSQVFRKGQSNYLKRLKNREESERHFFDDSYGASNGEANLFSLTDDPSEDLYDKGFTTAQLQTVEDNTAIVEQREKEIQHIVRSISDLNEIFKDLAVMIVDQGTILDRIDYNVEQASVQVEKGLQQLQKGEKYQKRSRKMLFIMVLALLLIIMLVVLVITKSKSK